MKPCLSCSEITCQCKRKDKAMTKNYVVDITLKCDLIPANNLEELGDIINNYLDNLAKQEDESITWSEVAWTVSEEL